MPKRNKKRDQDGIFERPDSQYWWASFTDGRGKPTRCSTGVRKFEDSGKERARLIRAQWVLEASITRCKGPAPESEGYTFDELMLAYMQGPSTEKRSPERDRYSIKSLYPIFTGRVLTTLTTMDVRNYILGRKSDGVSPGTINREVGLLSAAINWARSELDWGVPNPARGRRLREPDGRIRWLAKEESVALMQAAQGKPHAPHLPDFILLGLHTGMRAGEMLGLEWARVDLEAGLVYLESEHQKNGRRRSVPLNSHAREAIISRARFRADHCPDSPWVFCNREGHRIASVKTSFKNACNKAGIIDFHPHDLRHTCAAWLVQAGVQLPEIRDLLRHSTIKMTERYAHLAPHNVRAAVRVLDGEVSRSGFTFQKTNDQEVLETQ